MFKLKLEFSQNSFENNFYSELDEAPNLFLEHVIKKVVVNELKNSLDQHVEKNKLIRNNIEWIRPRYHLYGKPVSLAEITKTKFFNLGFIRIFLTLPKGAKIQISDSNHLKFLEQIKIKNKELKTISKFIISIYSLGINTDILLPIQEQLSTPCDCKTSYLTPYINGVWDYNLRFICKFCGKSYICECFRKALDKEYSRLISKGRDNISGDYDLNKIKAYEESSFREKICHLCRGVPSELHFCHPMYGSEILVKYGPYIYCLALEKEMSHRDAENLIRDKLGVPRIGEGWISEMNLVNIVRDIFPNEIVNHQASPDWLGNQRLDIFIPSRHLAIEYQGKQHYEPVDFFGGVEGFHKTKERDKNKKSLCEKNGIYLIYFSYDEEINKSFVVSRIRKYSKQIL
jgi:hypothetical protein